MNIYRILLLLTFFLSACAPEPTYVYQTFVPAEQKQTEIRKNRLTPQKTVSPTPKPGPSVTSEVKSTPEPAQTIDKEIPKDITDTAVAKGLTIDIKKIQYGTLFEGVVLERKDKTFVIGEDIAIVLPVSGLKVENGFITYNQDIIIKKDEQQLLSQKNIFGEKGSTLETSDLLQTANLLITTNLKLNSKFAGTLTAIITIKDFKDQSKSGSFTAHFTLQ